MTPHLRRVHWGLGFACAIAIAAVWLHARPAAEDDDRPQIIVRSGSVIIENGNGTKPPTPWTRDSVLGEWKPADDNFREAVGFDVTFEKAYADCNASTVSSSPVTIPAMDGKEIQIEFSYKKVARVGQANSLAAVDAVAKVHFHLRRSHWGGAFGKYEPKLDDLGFADTTTQPPPASQQLMFPLPNDALISRVIVAGNSPCAFPAPPDDATRKNFHVLIQPKAAHP
jgi:hypothetical protein